MGPPQVLRPAKPAPSHLKPTRVTGRRLRLVALGVPRPRLEIPQVLARCLLTLGTPQEVALGAVRFLEALENQAAAANYLAKAHHLLCVVNYLVEVELSQFLLPLAAKFLYLEAVVKPLYHLVERTYAATFLAFLIQMVLAVAAKVPLANHPPGSNSPAWARLLVEAVQVVAALALHPAKVLANLQQLVVAALPCQNPLMAASQLAAHARPPLAEEASSEAAQQHPAGPSRLAAAAAPPPLPR